MNNGSALQQDAWLWVAALASATAFLPVVAAEAGSGGWVVPVLALPGVLAADRLWLRVSSGGFGGNLRNILGARLARILTIIYIMWAVVLGGVQLHMCVRRMAAVEPTGETWLLTGAVVLLAVWFARKPAVVTARWAVPVLAWLVVSLGATAVLALPQVQWDNLVPLWSDGTGLFRAALSALGVLCIRMCGVFLGMGSEGEKNRGGRRGTVVCAVVSALLLVTQGSLGVALAARVEHPLLTLSRNVGVEGTFQRAESLLASVLLLGDVALVALLLCAIEKSVSRARRISRGRCIAVAAVGMLGSAAAMSEGVQMRVVRVLVPTGNLILGVGMPLLALAIMCVRRKKT